MLSRLSLTEFRNHAALTLLPGQQFVILHGANGAGKTNILEAISLLVPGRGMRRAALSEIARNGGTGAFSVAAELGDVSIGTGTASDQPERRKVRINGANASINSLAEWLAVIWLTPAMDRLFTDSAGTRRRFFDRLVLALEPAHAAQSNRYEQGVRQRNKLLTGDTPPDPAWLDAIEAAMGESGAAINGARNRLIAELSDRLAATPKGPFALPRIALDRHHDEDASILIDGWRRNRGRDTAAGRTLIGPHRADVIVHHIISGQAAEHNSTGEQKALLLSIILAHAALVADLRGAAPILLLDEVAAHLDPFRRAALYERLAQTGGQVWMTGTEASLFDGVAAGASVYEIGEANKCHPALMSPSS
jgi:DNA replication and repair protein RecF